MTLGKARDRLGLNIMDLVDNSKHIRTSGRALTKSEIRKILSNTRTQDERDIIQFYLLTGCRPDEINRIKVGHINLDRNEIFIDGTKNALSKRTMPILPHLRQILERRIQSKGANSRLFSYNYKQIYIIKTRISQKTGIKFTLKDLRHTCSTNCKDSGIPLSVYYKWFGWSSERMARKVYNHETESDFRIAQEWAQKFHL